MAHVIREPRFTSDHTMFVTARGEKASVEGNQRARSSRAMSAQQRFHLPWGGQEKRHALVKVLTGPFWPLR